MRLSALVGERFREKPADCLIDSHALMVKGGYIKYVANGIFSLYTPTKRICRKIERIIREEMDAIGGQEVMFPVVLPGSLWEESGRYESVGEELLRFKDRNNTSMVLGMTHEEAAVHLVKEYANSYSKYPFMIYQIQTKFRDEARPRAGLLRVREFTMKDAYSFHTSQEDLESYYDICLKAYNRIFERAGIPEVVAVKSDSGMMGGRISHEFMLLTPIGEDSIAICQSCGFKANMEATEAVFEKNIQENEEPLTRISTPNISTIDDLASILDVDKKCICKAVVYKKNLNDEYVIVFIRGDLEVNETKLRNILQEDIHAAQIDDTCGLVAGYIGPIGITENVIVMFDSSLEGLSNLVCGANEVDSHFTGLSFSRDLPNTKYYDLSKVCDGSICPICGAKKIKIFRGVEVGNIFQLGTKYTESMNMKYVDADGVSKYPIMGCYGIGVGRLAASVCEAHHDENGPIWPINIAPWEVHICCLRTDDENNKSIAEDIYEQLIAKHVEVLYDDRSVSAGVKFADADLLGIPLRIIVSPRNTSQHSVEIMTRDKSLKAIIDINDAIGYITDTLKKLYEEANHEHKELD